MLMRWQGRRSGSFIHLSLPSPHTVREVSYREGYLTRGGAQLNPKDKHFAVRIAPEEHRGGERLLVF